MPSTRRTRTPSAAEQQTAPPPTRRCDPYVGVPAMYSDTTYLDSWIGFKSAAPVRRGVSGLRNSSGATTVLDRQDENRLMSRREAMKHHLGAAVAATTCGARSAPNQSSRQVFDVQHFGARGDGKSLDLAAIRKAIEVASCAQEAAIRLPPREYWLGEVGPSGVLRLNGV